MPIVVDVLNNGKYDPKDDGPITVSVQVLDCEFKGNFAGYGGASLPSLSFGQWMRNLAIGGAVLGALIGLARAWLLHAPAPVLGMFALRLGIAGAAIGASFPALFRGGFAALRAAAWIALAFVLWVIAATAAGQAAWLQRWLH